MHYDNINLTHEQELSSQDEFEHKQVEVKVNGESFTVDEGLEEIIYNLNKRDMSTLNSCINNFGNIWIHFCSYSDFNNFFKLSLTHKPLWDFFQKNTEITVHLDGGNVEINTITEDTITEIMENLKKELVKSTIPELEGRLTELMRDHRDDVIELLREHQNEDTVIKYSISPISIRFPKELLNEFKKLLFESFT